MPPGVRKAKTMASCSVPAEGTVSRIGLARWRGGAMNLTFIGGPLLEVANGKPVEFSSEEVDFGELVGEEIGDGSAKGGGVGSWLFWG